ncbi:MAG: sulfite exporter TauE/SafE family protein [Ottowia sp.]|nr:sulfite exporter TauE/SafE family protein [Ottowia sp.]
MTFFLISALLVLGAISGFASGLLGIGGGMVAVPFLVMLFSAQNIPSDLVTHMAIATAMATILFTALSSVRAHHLRGAVRWPIVCAVAPGILVGVMLGGRLFAWLPATLLTFLFAGFVSFSAWRMLRQIKLVPGRSLPGKLGLASAGVVIGFVSSLVGAGGGFLSVPFFTWCNMSMHSAIATSAALGVPIALFATLSNVVNSYHLENLPLGALGYVYMPALFSIVSASVLTAPLGAKLAHRMNVLQLRRSFALVLLAQAIYMIVRGINTLL